jgi:hypothetical protein
MKKTTLFSASILAMAMSVLFLFPGIRLQARELPKKTKIGVYDSRAVVFAWSRSEMFRGNMAKFGRQSDSAQIAGDTAKIRELTVRMISYQHLLHQMVFGTGTVAAIMEQVKDRLPEVAEKAGVSMIVSKFEVNFSDPSIEKVDVTNLLIPLFKPMEDIEKMVGEIEKTDPVPLEDLAIEEEMLDGFCTRFGKK